FSRHRNEVLSLSQGKADFFLLIVADDRLILSKPLLKQSLDQHYYMLDYHKGFCKTKRTFLIDGRLNWFWKGEIHEVLTCAEAEKGAFLPGAILQAGKEGFRSRNPNTLKEDLSLLKCTLANGNGDERTVFHLAVFSEEAQDLASALRYFEQRASMGGWDQEVFYSLFRIAALQEALHFDPRIFLAGYASAYAYRPSRIEPLAALAFYYIKKKEDSKAYPLLKQAIHIPLSQDAIYVIVPLYEYEALFAFADVAYRLGKYEETWDAYVKLLRLSSLPPEYKEIIEKNRPSLLAKVCHRRGGLSPCSSGNAI
ncbi:MAG TPA: hypothetical protein DCE71_00540, partial [Parachlamydiales bacterium]|nr:hypothetical protein [Parachlamydiales bacterium]